MHLTSKGALPKEQHLGSVAVLLVLGMSTVFAAGQIPAHEASHWVACKLANGRECAIFYNISVGNVEGAGARLLVSAAGLLFTWIVLAGLVLTARYSTGTRLDAVFAMTSLAAARPLLLGIVYIVSQGTAGVVIGSDEREAAAFMDLPTTVVILGSTIIAGLCWYLVAKRLHPVRVAFLLGPICAGGVAGTLLWFRILGPEILPWS